MTKKDTNVKPQLSFLQLIYFLSSETGCARICPPGNGQVNQNASFAQFICDDGFHLDRQHSSTLQCKCESGATNSCSWSGRPPTCVATIFVHEPSITDINAFSTPLDVTSQHTSKVTEQPMTITGTHDLQMFRSNIFNVVVKVYFVLSVFKSIKSLNIYRLRVVL